MQDTETDTKQHRWGMMSIQPVEIIGESPDGQPFGFLQEEAQRGVNCLDCGEPWRKENDQGTCAGMEDDG